MSHKKRTILYIGLICILIGGVCLLWLYTRSHVMSYTKNPMQATVQTASSSVLVNATTTQPSEPVSTSDIHFEVVKDTVAQEKGLGGRSAIPDNYGMLFVFPTDGSYGFWMKDMLTSIDMIWITDNGTIIGIASNVSPSSYPNVFYPPGPVRYVLETKVGLATEKNWTVGTRISLPVSALLPT